jgi:hypothetical protein
LTDINDEPPVFDKTEYEFSISERAAPNTKVGNVHASDGDLGANAMLQYSIVAGHDGKFYIDRLSGKSAHSVFRFGHFVLWKDFKYYSFFTIWKLLYITYCIETALLLTSADRVSAAKIFPHSAFS